MRERVLRELAATDARLGDGGSLSPTDVHEARKHLKRARALLALLRPALDTQDFITCDDALRATGKSLAASRDATVLARTYARLRKRQRPSTSTTAASRSRMDGRAGSTPADPETARRVLRPGLECLKGARLVSRGWTALGSGLRAVYRRGRRRMAAAESAGHDPSGARLHAWRRHAKRYWHVLELFEVVDPDRLRPVVANLRRLSEMLGHEHDLALLAAHLGAQSRRRVTADVDVLREIAARRTTLTRRAFKLGARIYAERPREVEERMRRDWRRWRRG